MKTKTCPSCGEQKSLDEFWNAARYRDGKQSWCKECQRNRNFRVRATPGNKTWAYRKLYSARYKARKEGTAELIGTAKDVLDLWVQCDGCCEVCGVKSDSLHLDHCHKTGKLRGFLCCRHNLVAGLIESGEIYETECYLKKAI